MHWKCRLRNVGDFAQGPFYHHGLTLFPPWVSNHLSSKMWDEITYPFPNFNGCIIEVWDGCIIEVWEGISNFITHIITDFITFFETVVSLKFGNGQVISSRTL